MPTNIWLTSLALLLLMIPAYGVNNLNVMEIRQILPVGGIDARDHHIQMKASGATNLPTGLHWELSLTTPSEEHPTFSSTIYEVIGDEVTVTFPNPLPDFDYVYLFARDASEELQGLWYAVLELRDLKARVAVVGSSDGANAFLRVTTGDFLDEVIVDANTNCSSQDSPCYFLAKLPENIEQRCVDLKTAKAETVTHCDDTFSKFEALVEQPALHLHDDTELKVSYNAIPDSVEVLLVNTTNGEQIPNSEGISCTLGDQECSLTISNRIDAVDIMVVMLDDKGYVVGSDTYPFENYAVSWLGLSSDVLIASWVSSEKSDFLVKLLLDSAPVSQSVLTCGGDGTVDASSCELFFAEVDLTSINTITVEKQNDTNSVGSTGDPRGDTPPCSITTLTISDGNNGNSTITFEVTTDNGIPSSATIVEIINDPDNEVGSSIKYTGQVSVLSPESYTVEVSLTTPVFGDKKFILIGHNETTDNGIQEMGTLYSTLIDFKGDVHRVGNADVGVSALWLTNKDGESFSMDNVPCETVDLCYLLDFPTTRDTVPVCTEITNGDGTLNQCVIKKPEVAEVMSLSKFQLKDRKNVVITAPFVSDKVHIILYNASHNKIETNCSPTSPSRVDEKTCTSLEIILPDDKQSAPLKALLVGIDNAGVVKDSTAVEVEDLQFTHNRFYDDTLTVEWTASNPEGYTATLQELPVALEAISLKANGEVVPSNIECGAGSCAAFYRDLNPSASYALSVSRIGEPISETSEVIEMNTISVVNTPEMKIANVKKIEAKKTEINLAAETEVNIAFKFYVLVEMPGIQFLSPADIVTKTLISFNHDIPIFDGAKLTTFILLCYDLDNSLSKKGRAYLELQNLDSKLAWVAPENTKSLRVDAGSQEEVVIGARKCLKKDSPCYFIEDKSLPDTVERCVPVQNTADNTLVTQCDTEITSFKELTGVDVTLSGNNVEVSVSLENPNDFLEVKIYDPANSSAIFSVGNASCDATVNGSSTTCLQPLRTPSDRRPAKVLVVEMDTEGVVLKSSVSDITFPATGVESWVIAVSVLASVLGVAVIVFVTVVVVKKQKSKKVVRKELEIISGDDGSRSIAFDDIDDDRYSRIEQRPYKTKNPAPPVPMKPLRRDSVPPMGSYGNPYGPGYDNPAYGRGERFGDAPVGLPRIQPRIQGGPGRPGYY